MLQVLDTITDATGFCKNTAEIWWLVGTIINVVKVVIPIIIIVLALFDLGKAVMAGEDKEIKEAQKMLVKRLIYGVLIFFVVTIVQVAVSLVSGNWRNDAGVCLACVNHRSEDCINADGAKVSSSNMDDK